MINREINEYLAEHLFDIDIKSRFYCCSDQEEAFNKNDEFSLNNTKEKNVVECSFCGNLFLIYKGEVQGLTTRNEIPNYIEDWQQVVEKLLERGYYISRLSPVVDKRMIVQNKFICELDHCYLINSHYLAYGETIGKAVCKATVEYLKRS